MKRRTHIGALGIGLLAGRLGAEPPPRTGTTARPVRVGVMVKDAESWVIAQVMQRAYAAAGISQTFVPMPPARAGISVITGDVDADLMRITNFGVLHPQLVRVPTPVYHFNVIAASLETRHLAVPSREDLMRYTVGAVRGYFFVHEMTEKHPSVTLTQSSVQLVRMLTANRVDLALDTPLSMLYTLRRMGVRNVQISEPLASYALYHYLHPSNAGHAAPLDRALLAMTANGTLARLTKDFEEKVLDLRPEQLY